MNRLFWVIIPMVVLIGACSGSNQKSVNQATPRITSGIVIANAHAAPLSTEALVYNAGNSCTDGFGFGLGHIGQLSWGRACVLVLCPNPAYTYPVYVSEPKVNGGQATVPERVTIPHGQDVHQFCANIAQQRSAANKPGALGASVSAFAAVTPMMPDPYVTVPLPLRSPN